MRISGVNFYKNGFYSESKKRNWLNNNSGIKKDKYIHSDISVLQTYNKHQLNAKKCPDSVLDMINFETLDLFKQGRDKEHSIIVGNTEYLKKDLPKVDYGRCSEIKAVNNKVVFDNKLYYGYQDKSGNKHVFACLNNRLEQPYSDLISGRQNNDSFQICKFWNMLSKDGTYLGLYYSNEKQKQMLNDAGITQGFFSVQIGDNKQDYYYSNGNAGVAVRRFEYDATYDMFVKRGTALFNEYEVGSIFKIGGKEYILNEQRKLDIPYGEDIFDIELPKKEVE